MTTQVSASAQIESRASSGRHLRTLIWMSGIVVAMTTTLVILVAIWSADRSDEASRDRQHKLVDHAISKLTDRLPHDLASIAVWDDPIIKVHRSFDKEWTDANLGLWLHDYFKHDRVAILSPDNSITYEMKDGVGYAIPNKPATGIVATLAGALRARTAGTALDDFDAGKTSLPNETSLTLYEGRPAAISVVPFVTMTKELRQPRGQEMFILCVRFMDGSFLDELSKDVRLQGFRYDPLLITQSHEESRHLVGRNGNTLGAIVWTPQLPGRTILNEIVPVMMLSLVAIAAAIAFLIRRLHGMYDDLAKSESQAQFAALNDAVTGLPNRMHFTTHLEQALQAAQPSDAGDLALFLIDLDRFKEANDRWGHPVGDELLQAVARRLRECDRAEDFRARIGGDEFAVIARLNSPDDSIVEIAENLMARLQQPFMLKEHWVSIGASIGIAVGPRDGANARDLIRNADIALYSAKRAGRQRFMLYTDELSSELRQRRDLQLDLRRALASKDELSVAYQTIHAADDERIVGVEALARWTHPRLGPIAPSLFVSLAEESGLIDTLGEFVLKTAVHTAANWGLEHISVNVSPTQLLNEEFPALVMRILSDAGVPPQHLEIEITESTLLESTGTSAWALETLRAAGVRIALDDFGTGYCSLNYLMNHGVEAVKIDRSFVTPILVCPKCQAIVRSIIDLAAAVGIDVTAEGVESEALKEALQSYGCTRLQGYLYTQPLTALDMEKRLLLARPKEAPRLLVHASRA